jgi:hypothetical protein
LGENVVDSIRKLKIVKNSEGHWPVFDIGYQELREENQLNDLHDLKANPFRREHAKQKNNYY